MAVLLSPAEFANWRDLISAKNIGHYIQYTERLSTERFKGIQGQKLESHQISFFPIFREKSTKEL